MSNSPWMSDISLLSSSPLLFFQDTPSLPSVLLHLPFRNQLWWHCTTSHRHHVIPNPPSRTTLRKKCVRPLTFTSCDKRQRSYPMSPASPSLHQINGVIHQLRYVVALLSHVQSFSSPYRLRKYWAQYERLSRPAEYKAISPAVLGMKHRCQCWVQRQTASLDGWFIHMKQVEAHNCVSGCISAEIKVS